jgi:hypothetical protein
MSRESNAGMENEAYTSSLKLFSEWLLLFPAPRTKYLYHMAKKHTPNSPDTQGQSLNSRAPQVNWTDDRDCILVLTNPCST